MTPAPVTARARVCFYITRLCPARCFAGFSAHLGRPFPVFFRFLLHPGTGRSPNRPAGGFSGLRPLAPAKPGRPAAGPFLSRAPLLHRLPLTLPRGGLPSGQKFTFIADKIAGTTPPCLSQKPSNIIANNLRFSREPLFERGSPPPSLRSGLFFWWTTPPLMRYTGDGNLPRR